MIEPYSLEAEQSVLGAILIDPDGAIPQVIDLISPGDFYIAGHGRIYIEALNLYSMTHAVDYVTITEKMAGIDEIGGVPTKQYLIQLVQMVPTIANTKAYAEIVRTNAKARNVRNILLDATQTEITAENVNEISESVMSRLFDSTSGERRDGLQPLKKVVPDWYTGLFQTGTQRRADTGYGDMDGILNGMWDDELIVLAARPGVGKTAFALSIAEKVARTGKAVNVFSCEMSKSQLVERMMATESGVDLTELVNSRTLIKDQGKVGKVAAGVDALHKLPINLSDDAAITVTQVQAQSRMAKELGLIVVDYIQLMQASGRKQNRNDEVGEISRGLKLCAKSLHVPILALSQLNRDVEKRGISRPTLSDLRDSGNIEQDADKIIFGWKPDPERDIVEFDVAKNRRGKMGAVQFLFDGAHMKYSQLVKSDYVKPRKTKGSIQYDNDF